MWTFQWLRLYRNLCTECVCQLFYKKSLCNGFLLDKVNGKYTQVSLVYSLYNVSLFCDICFDEMKPIIVIFNTVTSCFRA